MARIRVLECCRQHWSELWAGGPQVKKREEVVEAANALEDGIRTGVDDIVKFLDLLEQLPNLRTRTIQEGVSGAFERDMGPEPGWKGFVMPLLNSPLRMLRNHDGLNWNTG